MTLQSIAVTTLLTVSGLLGVAPVAKDLAGWKVVETWHEVAEAPASLHHAEASASAMMFVAESSQIAQDCKQNPSSYVAFPAVIHGSHVISVDGHIVSQFGDPTFQTTRSFFGQPVVSCKDIGRGSVVRWEAYSYTKYFARISSFPKLTSHLPVYNVFAETFHIIGAGAGVIMAIFAFTIFAGKVSRSTTLSVAASSFFSSFYLGGCVAGFMGIPTSMLVTHKIADIGVWISIALLVNALRYEQLVSARVALSFLGTCFLAAVIILLGDTGDLVQFGTTLPFVLTLFVLTIPMLKLGKKLFTEKQNRLMWLQFFSLGSFVLAVFNEMFAVTGLIHSSPMLPFGFMSGVMFLALAVNERVKETYTERDHLRNNLEQEVQRKTAELQNKTFELQATMASLQSTQAELVQSAKLASLGTLAAGIAHEINNSVNYVNGAIQPLEKIVAKSCQAEDSEKIGKLFAVMKEGLHLTVDIIKSLRNYTGLNQAKFNDVSLHTAVNSTLTILKSKIRGRIDVQVDVPEDIQVYGSVVGINQVFMNLISNALDAIPGTGRLVITAKQDAKVASISIRDSGTGMSAETQMRIFEPFFTTKAVGQGTGLGLHIVKTEMERHKGTVSVESRNGEGTCFTLVFPKDAETTASFLKEAGEAA